jgi:ATP-dependent Lon protease
MAEEKDEQLIIPDILPLLPIRDVVIFPYMIVPLFVSRESSINAVDKALSRDRLIFMATQKDVSKEEPAPEDIYTYGTVGMIMRMLKLPDGRVKILVQGIARGKVNTYLQSKPSYTVDITKIKEVHIEKLTMEKEAMMRNIRESLEKLSSLGKVVFPEVMMVLDNIEDAGRLSDLVAANLGLNVDVAQQVLEIRSHRCRQRSRTRPKKRWTRPRGSTS